MEFEVYETSETDETYETDNAYDDMYSKGSKSKAFKSEVNKYSKWSAYQLPKKYQGVYKEIKYCFVYKGLLSPQPYESFMDA